MSTAKWQNNASSKKFFSVSRSRDFFTFIQIGSGHIVAENEIAILIPSSLHILSQLS
jgi:hypothetical protein